MKKETILRMLKSEIAFLNDIASDWSGVSDITTVEIDILTTKTRTIQDLIALLSGTEQPKQPNHDRRMEESIKPQPELTSAPFEINKKETEPIVHHPVIEPKVEEKKEEALPVPEITTTQPIIQENIQQPVVAVGNPNETEAPAVEQIVEKEATQPTITQSVIEPTEQSKPAEEVVMVEFQEEKKDISPIPVQPKPEVSALQIPTNQTTEPESPKMQIKETQAVADETKTTEIVADRFQNKALSINEMMASFKKNSSLAAKLKDMPIYDLKSAIKINDRIWFINELFGRDADAYNQAVDTINRCKNLDDALAYVFNTFDWDQDKPVVTSFLELIFRRFTNL